MQFDDAQAVKLRWQDGICAGFEFAPGYVLTCLHAVFEVTTKQPRAEVFAFPGKQQDTTDYRSGVPVQLLWPDSLDEIIAPGGDVDRVDVAILKASKVVHSESRDTDAKVHRFFRAYHAELRVKASGYPAGTENTSIERRIATNIDVTLDYHEEPKNGSRQATTSQHVLCWSGMSGAALYRPGTQQIVGVIKSHIRGASNVLRAVTFDLLPADTDFWDVYNGILRETDKSEEALYQRREAAILRAASFLKSSEGKSLLDALKVRLDSDATEPDSLIRMLLSLKAIDAVKILGGCGTPEAERRLLSDIFPWFSEIRPLTEAILRPDDPSRLKARSPFVAELAMATKDGGPVTARPFSAPSSHQRVIPGPTSLLNGELVPSETDIRDQAAHALSKIWGTVHVAEVAYVVQNLATTDVPDRRNMALLIDEALLGHAGEDVIHRHRTILKHLEAVSEHLSVLYHGAGSEDLLALDLELRKRTPESIRRIQP